MYCKDSWGWCSTVSVAALGLHPESYPQLNLDVLCVSVFIHVPACVSACVPVCHQAGDTMCGVVVLDLQAPCDLASITLHVAGVASADFEVHVAKEHGVALGGSGRYSTSPKRRQGCLAWHRVDKIQRRRNVQVSPTHVCTPCLHSGDGGACRVRELRPLVTHSPLPPPPRAHAHRPSRRCTGRSWLWSGHTRYWRRVCTGSRSLCPCPLTWRPHWTPYGERHFTSLD